MREELWLRFES